MPEDTGAASIKRPFEFKGVYVKAVVRDEGSRSVKSFRLFSRLWIHVLPGLWNTVNRYGNDFDIDARIDVKGVQIGGEKGKLESGWLGVNKIFRHDGGKPPVSKKRHPVEIEDRRD